MVCTNYISRISLPAADLRESRENALRTVTFPGSFAPGSDYFPWALFFLGLGGDFHGTIDQGLAGEAVVVGFVFEAAFFDRRAGR
jgi:hypothetical protein